MKKFAIVTILLLTGSSSAFAKECIVDDQNQFICEGDRRIPLVSESKVTQDSNQGNLFIFKHISNRAHKQSQDLSQSS